jgi:hypothetical protein
VAEARLIAAYLGELHHDIERLLDADAILAEVEDHLLEAREVFERAGRDPLAAELEALAQFGTPSLVSQALITEARKGSAVATKFTRHAGLAALLIPVFAVVGQIVNAETDRGFVHGIGITMLGLMVPLLGVAIVGMFKRHRGALGRWGTTAAVLFIAAVPLSFTFGWGALAALEVILLISAVAVLTIGMLKAGVLPRLPIVMFGLAGAATLAGGAIAAAFGHHMGNAIVFEVSLFEFAAAFMAAGLAWLGWIMWREDALDVPTDPTSLATI